MRAQTQRHTHTHTSWSRRSSECTDSCIDTDQLVNHSVSRSVGQSVRSSVSFVFVVGCSSVAWSGRAIRALRQSPRARRMPGRRRPRGCRRCRFHPRRSRPSPWRSDVLLVVLLLVIINILQFVNISIIIIIIIINVGDSVVVDFTFVDHARLLGAMPQLACYTLAQRHAMRQLYVYYYTLQRYY